MTIEKLQEQFTGLGEVRGFKFTKIMSNDYAILYEVDTEDTIYYEVFKRRVLAKCVNFMLKEYSDTEFKEKYPKAKDFGKWAWTYMDKDTAIQKYLGLCVQLILQ